jgi:hypothetical protein
MSRIALNVEGPLDGQSSGPLFAEVQVRANEYLAPLDQILLPRSKHNPKRGTSDRWSRVVLTTRALPVLKSLLPVGLTQKLARSERCEGRSAGCGSPEIVGTKLNGRRDTFRAMRRPASERDRAFLALGLAASLGLLASYCQGTNPN